MELTGKDTLGYQIESLGYELKDIYHYDTLRYTLHKSGFYLSESGDIFQKNSLAYDDDKGIWARHYWLDSLMDVYNDPKKKTLKEVIDLNTYQGDIGDFFSKDKNHVYFLFMISDGIFHHIVEKADPKTFVGIKGGWGKDNNQIFYRAEIVNQADVNTFQVFGEYGDSAKDKNNIYHLGKIIK